MFGGLPLDAAVEYQGEINEGDLLILKEGMMLVPPNGPVLVMSANKKAGIYEIMYTSNNYTVTCSRIDIKDVFCEAG